MSARKLLAANWKMHLAYPEAQNLVRAVAAGLAEQAGHPPVVLCVPAPYLLLSASITQAYGDLYTGAQNLHQEAQGAYTGEVSGQMIRSCGAGYVLVGHSERRQYFLEDDATIAAKLRRALAEGLIPILCVGESRAEREAGHTEPVILRQLAGALGTLTAAEVATLVLAYEPVWAIGTGLTATVEQAGAVHQVLRSALRMTYGEAVAEGTTILYGGSVNAGNAAALFAHSDIDGGLVGGASLDAVAFLAVAAALGS